MIPPEEEEEEEEEWRSLRRAEMVVEYVRGTVVFSNPHASVRSKRVF